MMIVSFCKYLKKHNTRLFSSTIYVYSKISINKMERISEARLRKIVKESVRHALNEGTTNQEDFNICDEIFDMWTGRQVWEFIYNMLNSDQIHEIAEELVDAGFYDDGYDTEE